MGEPDNSMVTGTKGESRVLSNIKMLSSKRTEKKIISYGN